jgi:hypothetical protein
MILHAINNLVKSLFLTTVLIGCDAKKNRIQVEKDREGENITKSIPLEKITEKEFRKKSYEEFEQLKENNRSDNDPNRR